METDGNSTDAPLPPGQNDLRMKFDRVANYVLGIRLEFGIAAACVCVSSGTRVLAYLGLWVLIFYAAVMVHRGLVAWYGTVTGLWNAVFTEAVSRGKLSLSICLGCGSFVSGAPHKEGCAKDTRLITLYASTDDVQTIFNTFK